MRRCLPVLSTSRQLLCSGTVFPALEKVIEASTGHDGFFVASTPYGGAAGVADGVGGWESQGIDPSRYSRGLMAACLEASTSPPDELLDAAVKLAPGKKDKVASSVALQVLTVAHAAVPGRDTVGNPRGSSTVCLAALAADSSLHVANLGDSKAIVARLNDEAKYEAVLVTPDQTTSFNAPYQVGTGGHQPWDAEVFEVDVEAGDVVVLFTDGVSDNLAPEDVLAVLDDSDEVATARSLASTEGNNAAIPVLLHTAALQLGTLAMRTSFDKKADTPFAREAKAAGMDWQGGKPDDITAVVGVVTVPVDSNRSKL